MLYDMMKKLVGENLRWYSPRGTPFKGIFKYLYCKLDKTKTIIGMSLWSDKLRLPTFIWFSTAEVVETSCFVHVTLDHSFYVLEFATDHSSCTYVLTRNFKSIYFRIDFKKSTAPGCIHVYAIKLTLRFLWCWTTM